MIDPLTYDNLARAIQWMRQKPTKAESLLGVLDRTIERYRVMSLVASDPESNYDWAEELAALRMQIDGMIAELRRMKGEAE